MAWYKPLGHGLAPLAPEPIGSSKCAEETPLLYHAEPFSVAHSDDLLASGIQPEEVSVLSRLRVSKMVEVVENKKGMIGAFGTSSTRRKGIKPLVDQGTERFGVVLTPIVFLWTNEQTNKVVSELFRKGRMESESVCSLAMEDIARVVASYGDYFPERVLEHVSVQDPKGTLKMYIRDIRDGDTSLRKDFAMECAISCASAVAGIGAAVLASGTYTPDEGPAVTVIIVFHPHDDAGPVPSPSPVHSSIAVSSLASMGLAHLSLAQTLTSSNYFGKSVVRSHRGADCVFLPGVSSEWLEFAMSCSTIADVLVDNGRASALKQDYVLRKIFTLSFLPQSSYSKNTQLIVDKLGELWLRDTATPVAPVASPPSTTGGDGKGDGESAPPPPIAPGAPPPPIAPGAPPPPIAPGAPAPPVPGAGPALGLSAVLKSEKPPIKRVAANGSDLPVIPRNLKANAILGDATAETSYWNREWLVPKVIDDQLHIDPGDGGSYSERKGWRYWIDVYYGGGGGGGAEKQAAPVAAPKPRALAILEAKAAQNFAIAFNKIAEGLSTALDKPYSRDTKFVDVIHGIVKLLSNDQFKAEMATETFFIGVRTALVFDSPGSKYVPMTGPAPAAAGGGDQNKQQKEKEAEKAKARETTNASYLAVKEAINQDPQKLDSMAISEVFILRLLEEDNRLDKVASVEDQLNVLEFFMSLRSPYESLHRRMEGFYEAFKGVFESDDVRLMMCILKQYSSYLSFGDRVAEKYDCYAPTFDTFSSAVTKKIENTDKNLCGLLVENNTAYLDEIVRVVGEHSTALESIEEHNNGNVLRKELSTLSSNLLSPDAVLNEYIQKDKEWESLKGIIKELSSKVGTNKKGSINLLFEDTNNLLTEASKALGVVAIRKWEIPKFFKIILKELKVSTVAHILKRDEEVEKDKRDIERRHRGMEKLAKTMGAKPSKDIEAQAAAMEEFATRELVVANSRLLNLLEAFLAMVNDSKVVVVPLSERTRLQTLQNEFDLVSRISTSSKGEVKKKNEQLSRLSELKKEIETSVEQLRQRADKINTVNNEMKWKLHPHVDESNQDKFDLAFKFLKTAMEYARHGDYQKTNAGLQSAEKLIEDVRMLRRIKQLEKDSNDTVASAARAARARNQAIYTNDDDDDWDTDHDEFNFEEFKKKLEVLVLGLKEFKVKPSDLFKLEDQPRNIEEEREAAENSIADASTSKKVRAREAMNRVKQEDAPMHSARDIVVPGARLLSRRQVASTGGKLDVPLKLAKAEVAFCERLHKCTFEALKGRKDELKEKLGKERQNVVYAMALLAGELYAEAHSAGQ